MKTPIDDASAQHSGRDADAVDESQASPRCSCGYDRDHRFVSANRRYTLLGWVLMLTGISAKPIRIEYTCRQCGDVVETTEDPAALQQAAYR